MKKRTADILKTTLCLLIILILIRIPGIFPWWSFVIPVIILGAAISLAGWEIPAFGVGFLSGFLIWLGANLYFDLSREADILSRIAFSVALPKLVLLLISCLLGGVLTGLSLYTGKLIFTRTEAGLTL